MATLRPDGLTSLTTRPPKLTLPPLSGSRPASNRRTVLLPHPLGPTITLSSPSRTYRVRCEAADVPSGCTRETSSRRISAIPRNHHQTQPPHDSRRTEGSQTDVTGRFGPGCELGRPRRR